VCHPRQVLGLVGLDDSLGGYRFRPEEGSPTDTPVAPEQVR
jgi:hypothetical protein